MLVLRMRASRVVGSVALVLALSNPADAVTIDPDPIEFDGIVATFGIAGRVDFLGTTSGLPSGGQVLSGSVGPSDLSLLFRLEVDSTSTPFPNFGAQGLNGSLLGAGWIPGSGVDVSSATLFPGRFSFLLAGVGSGQASDVVFVTVGSDLATSDLLFFTATVPLHQSTVTLTVPALPSAATLLLAVLGSAWFQRSATPWLAGSGPSAS